MRKNRRVRTSPIRFRANGYYTDGYRWTAIFYEAGRPVRVLWKNQPRHQPQEILYHGWAGVA